jgi:hypothetical protein
LRGGRTEKLVMNSQIIYVSRCFSQKERKRKCKINRGKCKLLLRFRLVAGRKITKNIEKFDLQIIRKETDKGRRWERETEKLSIDLKATALRKLT